MMVETEDFLTLADLARNKVWEIRKDKLWPLRSWKEEKEMASLNNSLK